jgi:hypothetical protein
MPPSIGTEREGSGVGSAIDGNRALAEVDSMAVDDLIAYVLGRAHRMAEALNEPNEARAILHVAHSFADELATTDPRFDRERFIGQIVNDPS